MREAESLGWIQVPAPLSAELDRYFVHPAFLDACLQPVVAAMPTSVEPYLPQRLESFRVYRRPGDRAWSHVTLRQNAGIAGGEVAADIDVLDPDGQKLVEVRGLVLRRAGREAIVPTGQEDFDDDCLYEVKWEESPLQSANTGKPTASIPGPARVAEAPLPHSQTDSPDPGLREFASLLPRIEALSTLYVLRTLGELGWTIEKSQTFTTQSKARELSVPERYHRLLARMLEMLHQDGCLSKTDGGWKVSQVPPDRDPEEELSDLLSEHPAYSAELTLVGRCGRDFARAIRGEAEPLELLFPDGSFTDAERLYKDSPYYRFYNELLRQAVLEVAERMPRDRPLRILEIGAGTGSTTSYLLPHLRHRRTEYTFTDISNLFITRARETFAAYPFMKYRVLDIEKNPLEQGIGEHQFDLVVAANVLHATADLRQTLQQVKRLLFSEGLLMLLEGTRPLRFADVIVGLTEGWWRFTDTDLRPAYPLIAADQWRSLLAGSGFTEVAVSPGQDRENALSNQALIIARGPRISPSTRSVPASRGRWLLLTDSAGVGRGLQTALEDQGEECILVSAGKKFDRRDRGHFEIDAGCPEDFQRVLRESGCSNESALHGVMYLWPLDASPTSSKGWETLKEDIQKGCGGLLHLVQALVSGGNLLANRLWIVTRGAQPVDSSGGFTSLSQAPSAALGSTIALEYPELQCARIDLDPVASADEVAGLLEEVSNGKSESLVAFRQGRRLVARLVHSSADSREERKTPQPDLSQPYELRISSPGVLDNLSLCPMDRSSPGPGEVEIEVHATGLGFRDVLMALGRYPGRSQVLGYECAGSIVRVGEGITRFYAGQRVMAVGPGSYSAFLTMAEERVAPIPELLSDEQAATLPSAFLTAHYALCRLGRLSAGEKVLIHAAAGGVGLAAVQLAQRAGAEIFATAGSPEKRAYLASLGVPYVMDSRSLDFAGEIMETTGGRGVDLVLNSLAGDFIPKSLSVTALNGRFLEIGKTGIWDQSQVAQLNRNLSYFRIDLAAALEAKPDLVRSLFDELIPDFAKGLLKPLPFRSFPIDRVVPAFRFMAQARHIGKVVVSHPGFEGGRRDRADAEPRGRTILDAGGSYLITGGMRGLGLIVARWMSQQGAKHLVLMGRGEVSESAAAAIREIEARGTRIIVSRGDVSDRSCLADLFSQFGRSLPVLRGIVHSAGIVDDGVLTQQTWDRFERVMASKVEGTWHLHILSQNQPLDFFVLFSSAVSMLGSAGQANHVAACAFEDALAHYRHDLGLPALSINWGPWSEIGAATESGIGHRLRMKGFRPIEPKQGLRVLDNLLQGERVQAGVMSVDWRQYTDALPPGSRSTFLTRVLSTVQVQPPHEQRKAPQKPAFLDQLSQTPPKKRRPLLEAHIREHAVKVLGFNPSFKLDPNQGLASLGMDSLMTIELKNRLQASLGRSLSSTIVFDHPTVAALAEYLERNFLMVAEDAAEPGAEPQPEDERARTLSELQQMSDEDAEAILAKELSGST
jgi:NADPH:quinone reductase-like Zn-dependent oxidoreductase/SAM-dependent methyltransferase/acyl carrier protein